MTPYDRLRSTSLTLVLGLLPSFLGSTGCAPGGPTQASAGVAAARQPLDQILQAVAAGGSGSPAGAVTASPGLPAAASAAAFTPGAGAPRMPSPTLASAPTAGGLMGQGPGGGGLPSDPGWWGPPSGQGPNEGMPQGEGLPPPPEVPDSCDGSDWNPTPPTHGPIPSGGHFRASRPGGRLHDGIDLAVGTGTAIKAAECGRVVKAGWQGAYGLVVFVAHGNDYLTTYNHLSKVEVSVGQSVKRGQRIGRSGETGTGSGPHLHYEVWVPCSDSHPGVGRRCPRNPAPWI